MNRKFKVKGQLKTYLLWPIFLSILLIVADITIFFISIPAGVIASSATVVYLMVAVALYIYNKTIIMNELVGFATDYAQIQKKLLQDLTIPYGLIDMDGKVMWKNKELSKLIHREDVKVRSLCTMFDDISEDNLIFDGQIKELNIRFENREYRVELKKVDVKGIFNNDSIVVMSNDEDYLIAIYFFDETEIKRLAKDNIDQKMVAGLIYIDNYEEALESVEDVRRSLLIALIDRKINKYITGINGIVKKMEKDKYFIAIQQRYVETLQCNKFSLLDEVKSVNIGNEMDVTISIGLGVNGENYMQNCDYSRTAIDLALGRGGDQAVIKDQEKIYYYGGKTKQVEKNTRVKARVKAHALRELLETKDKVIIMGHKIGDVDSFGASIGLYRATKTLNKKAYIVINEITTSVRPMLERFVGNSDYEDDIFINSSEAQDLVDSNTAVIVVDVNRPSYTECPELLELSKATVVLDHHRQSSEIIENAVLSYIETYASSTCEMVSEILQYIHDEVKLRQPEADALYAGVMIDTNNFAVKTGVRTFEAAAFLRRNGADITRVRLLFRNDFNDFQARAEAVHNAEVYREEYAITECSSNNIESPTVVGAQVANELLNINHIKASFVVTNYNNMIYVSARSIDNLNVQLVMERLGGGGHMNVAGAQLLNCTIDEAKDTIKRTLDEMLEEGAI